MGVKAEVNISAPRSAVWNVITDIEGSVNVIEGIEKIRVLSKPEAGLVGLKWEETRTMFGREAMETMWITEAEDESYYQTRAEHPGLVYISELRLEDLEGGTKLIMSFDSKTSGLGRQIFSAIMGVFFNGATRKMIARDLEDIKNTVEGS